MSNNSKKYSFHSEAFVYLWFDSKNRMFYLGYHKGHPDDDYTHSSTIMESFTKTTIPSYMHRRILATGTKQEMIDLEKKLLDNRKERCWDKYYNATVAFPPPPMYGEDNPMWKGGIALKEEYYREYHVKNADKKREYYAKNADKKREYRREYYAKNAEKVREHYRKYYEENRERCREQQRKYYQENRERCLEQQRKYYEENREHRDKKIEYSREYYAKNADKIRKKQRERYAKKKAEKAAGKVHFGD